MGVLGGSPRSSSRRLRWEFGRHGVECINQRGARRRRQRGLSDVRRSPGAAPARPDRIQALLRRYRVHRGYLRQRHRRQQRTPSHPSSGLDAGRRAQLVARRSPPAVHAHHGHRNQQRVTATVHRVLRWHRANAREPRYSGRLRLQRRCVLARRQAHRGRHLPRTRQSGRDPVLRHRGHGRRRQSPPPGDQVSRLLRRRRRSRLVTGWEASCVRPVERWRHEAGWRSGVVHRGRRRQTPTSTDAVDGRRGRHARLGLPGRT